MTRLIVSIEKTDHDTYTVGGDTTREYATLEDAEARAEIMNAPVCTLPYVVLDTDAYGTSVVMHRWTRRVVTWFYSRQNALSHAAHANARANGCNPYSLD